MWGGQLCAAEVAEEGMEVGSIRFALGMFLLYGDGLQGRRPWNVAEEVEIRAEESADDGSWK